MHRLFPVIFFALFCAGCGVTSQTPDYNAEHHARNQLCSSLMASHRSILEAMFERELYSVTYQDEWHAALKSLKVSTSDHSGRTRDPGSILQAAINSLLQVTDAADRKRLEYLLLGTRMSLEDRKQFDDYCAATAP